MALSKKKAQWQREYRKNLKAKNLCIQCGKKPRDGESSRCADCRPKSLRDSQYYNQCIKDEVFEYYGGYVCACCGETNPIFLQLDHIDNNGKKDREEFGGGGKFFSHLRNNNYPPEFKLQVLCANCNYGKSRNGGVCPHVKEQEELTQKLAGIPLTY